MILELNNRLERLGLSVGLQTVLHVCPTTGQQCGPALLILDCYSSQLPSHSDSDMLDQHYHSNVPDDTVHSQLAVAGIPRLPACLRC